MNKPAVEHKRKIYFIEKSFQAKFILKFCILVAVGGLLTIGMLYLLAMQSTTVSFINSRVAVQTTADFLLPLLVQTTAVVLVVVGLATIAVTLFVSHKIAGPIYRIKKVIATLSEGNLSEDFRLRQFDQLQDIAVAFNNMVKNMRQQIRPLQENLRSLKEKVDGISEHEVSEHKRNNLTELKKLSAELNKIADYFKA